MSLVALSLGTNKGDRIGNIKKMRAGVDSFLQPPARYSPLMETEPVGVDNNQPWYFNLIVGGQFEGSPMELLKCCLQLEESLGRQRPYRYCARTADVDILFFDQVIIDSQRLTLPHPQLFKRRFCIEGLARIMPDVILPGRLKTFGEELLGMDQTIAGQKVYFR